MNNTNCSLKLGFPDFYRYIKIALFKKNKNRYHKFVYCFILSSMRKQIIQVFFLSLK